MKSQQIDEFANQVKAKYPDYATNPEAVGMVISHPEYSHNTIKQSWEANNIYFHCENSPTRVSACITFHKSMLQHINTPLEIGINARY